MSCVIGCCVFTRGEFLIRNATSECGSGFPLDCSTGSSFTKLGNISSALIEISGSVIGKENEFNPADPDSRTEILGVNLTVSLACASTKNLLRALYGAQPEPVDGIGFVEDFCLVPNQDLSDCDFYPFKNKGVDADSVVVYLRSAEGTVIRELTDDEFTFSASGISIATDVDIGAAVTLRLSYSYDNTDFPSIVFNSEAAKYKEIYFKGTNYGGDQPGLFDARFYRVLLAPVNQMDLITRDEFLTLNLAGSVEQFDGKWFKIDKQE